MRDLQQCAKLICIFEIAKRILVSLCPEITLAGYQVSSSLFFPCADTYDQSGLQEVQLEDGSTAYIQHTVHMPPSNTILAIQADGTIADLQAEATALDPDTISVLEQYTTKVNALCYLHPGTEWSLDMAFFFCNRSFLLLNMFVSSLLTPIRWRTSRTLWAPTAEWSQTTGSTCV